MTFAGVLAWKAWVNRVAAEVTFGTLWASEGPYFVDLGVESYLSIIVITSPPTPSPVNSFISKSLRGV